jgi:hypothetical protein
MDRARPFPDAARSLVTLSNPQTPFAELATHRRKALRHFFTWFAGVIARAEGGSGQSLTPTSLPGSTARCSASAANRESAARVIGG